MSAISGLVRFDEQSIDSSACDRVSTVMSVYGRDRKKVVVDESSGFIWNAFFVCPEDYFDDQPLKGHQSGLKVIFDGRIDNRNEIADLLSISRSDLASMSDSALVLPLIERFGDQAPDKLRGDFAIAVWDSRHKKLWLARDPAGLRPLFWYAGDGFVAFSSMPKGLFCFPSIPKQLNQQYLEDYLLLLPADSDRSLFEGVHRVIPGSIVTFTPKGVTREQYFDYNQIKQIRFSSDDEYVEAFKEILDKAVRRRLRSTTSIASYLSSGFDSSTISARAAQILGESGDILTCYTAVPAEGFKLQTEGKFHVDEGPGARAVAEMYDNIDHRLLRTGHLSPFRDLEEMIELLDRPPLNLCNSVWVNEIEHSAALDGNRVILSGSLGNATISYDGVPYLAKLVKSLQWITLGRILAPHFRKKNRLKKLRFFTYHSLAPLVPRLVWLLIEAREGRGFQSDPSSYTAIRGGSEQRKRLYQRAKELGWDLAYQPYSDGLQKRVDMLSRVDIGEYSMLANARGLDKRAPALDRDLVEFCLGIPDAQYVGGGRFRWILIRAMKEQLPREILYPRSAGLQAADWFIGASKDIEKLKTVLGSLSDNQSVNKIIDTVGLVNLAEDWPDGGWGSHTIDQRYRYKLLRGLTLGKFISYHSLMNLTSLK